MTAAAKLSGLRLLVVEDEALVAMMIQDYLADLGCVVVGVAASVSKGLAAIEDKASILDGAVLDVNLGGEKVYPVAERLVERGIPFIFSTGYGLAGIAPDFARIPTLSKPFGPRDLAAMLSKAIPPRGD
jgi:CheY-like chemotaxis protein